MANFSHQDFIEKLKSTEILSLLYLIVEAKTGKHVDIVGQVPREVIQDAETAIRQLISYSRSVAAVH